MMHMGNGELEDELAKAISKDGDGFVATKTNLPVNAEAYLEQAVTQLRQLRQRMLDVEVEYTKRRSTFMAEAADRLRKFDTDYDERMGRLRSMLKRLEALLDH